MNDRPRVSVVIPARDAAATIEAAVAAARAQRVDGAHEVVVVDDGSTDATARLARRAGAHVIRNESALGPAEARNRGVAAARGELLAFTDADCVPAPGWLAAGVAVLTVADIVQAPIAPEPGVEIGAFDHVISVEEQGPFFRTANLFVRREWFERVGGFEAFLDPTRGHFGEDVLFGWSVTRAGGRAAFAPAALVHHRVIRRPPAQWLRERARLGLFPELVRRVPEVRRYLGAGIFLSERSAAFDFAAAGLAAAAVLRRRRLALLAFPYVRRRLLAATPRVAFAYVVGDSLGAAVLIAGSIRTGSPVL